MNYEAEIQKTMQQQAELVFDSFGSDDAVAIGTALMARAKELGAALIVSITLNRRQLFFCAADGTSPDNQNWIRRKENVVYQFFKSSHQVSMEFKKDDIDPESVFGLSRKDYAAERGCFPIALRGAGVVGTIGVSGLASEEDHALVVEAIRAHLGK